MNLMADSELGRTGGDALQPIFIGGTVRYLTPRGKTRQLAV